jgi:hypothetical protein
MGVDRRHGDHVEKRYDDGMRAVGTHTRKKLRQPMGVNDSLRCVPGL